MRIVLQLILTACLLVSCSKPASLPKPKQRLNLNIPADPSTLDPRKGGDLTSSIFHFLLFEGLTRLNGDGSVSLALAEKVDISKDRTVYTFYLRDATWSNGSPITAWDFEKSWKDILHPDFPSMNAQLFYNIKNAQGAKNGTASLSEVGVNAIDAKTLEVTLTSPVPYFLELVSFCVFYPINAEIDHSHPDWEHQLGKKFICSGPFRIKEWKRNNEIILEKNARSYRADEIVLEKIHFSMVDNETTALHMFEKGQIDILGQPLIPLPADAVPKLRAEKKIKTHQLPATTFVTFNTKIYPFNNVNIRKAFALSINRQEIVDNITQLNEVPALSIIPPNLKKGDPKSYLQDADVEKAREHLELGLSQLGITKAEFPELIYIYSPAELHHKIAQALQQQWLENLDIKVEMQKVEKKYLVYLLKKRNYHFGQAFWMAQYHDPMNIFERFKYKENVKNYPNWENEEYMQLLDLSQVARTKEERNKILDDAESIFFDEMPLAPIFHWTAAYIVQPYIKSFDVAAVGNAFFDKIYIDNEIKESTH